MASPKLVAVGDCCIDHYQSEGWFPGGNALNVAVAWHGLGADASYVGAVGDDEAGAWLLAEIDSAGLDASLVSRRPGATGLTEISLNPDGEKQILAEHLGVSADFSLGHGFEPGRAEWVHGALSPSVQELVQAFRADGRGISFDFSTNRNTEDLEGLDVAFYSWEGRPSTETDALLESALHAGARLAVVMCGRYGSRALSADQHVSLDGNPIEPIDTCGAGDSFIANFVYSSLGGAGLEEAMRAGAAAGEEMCLNLGAWLNHEPERVA